jgi:PucR C-terminal helix-turn-helix domain/GGDEF-like domain
VVTIEAVPRSDVVAAERGRILSSLLSDLSALVDAAIEAMRAEIPAYAAQGDGFFADVREQVAAHYRTKLTAFLEQREVTLDEVGFIRGAAMRRARAGLALEHYINAFRVGEKVLWDAIVARAGEHPFGHEAALTLAAPLMRYVDFVTTHAAHAYVEFQQFALADADRERRDLLDVLLAGDLPADGPLHALAEQYGIAADVPTAVVVAVARGGGGSEPPHAARSALAATGSPDTKTLVVARRNEIVAIWAFGARGDIGAACDLLDRTFEHLRREGIELAIGVSAPAHGVRDLPRAYHEAREALDRVREAGGVAALPRLSPFDYLILRNDETARRLLDPELRRFLEEDRTRGGVLCETIRAFAGADLRVRETAERLHVHPNTAQYRLRRIQERTKRNPRRIADLIELLVAIRLESPARG